ncbi:sugar phosphate isomerase/epimerase family protein [Pedobacter sp. BS3]|uniref:sugar phosphate isomerase/epimerase family protein n=1 Tax=Pedobacter sp. BS3 TaxID=2567937 RepID=UPI0018D652EF|nr:sugar phosphate isomerase/epimerase [Pedobacter sp. BS3]
MLSIKFYCPRWGSEHIPWPDFVKNVKAAGYNGVEVYPLQTPEDKDIMLRQLEDAGLEFSLLHAEMKEGYDINKYLAALERNLYQLAEYQTNTIRPRFITSQTGREYYTPGQAAACFDVCDRISRKTGIKIIQETHRNKWSYAAHVVKAYLQKFPALELALDLSHWVCVSESYLEDQQEAIELAIDHAVHLHARVGHIEGPQVTDPRAPENAEALSHHLSWWDRWIERQIEKQVDECTITPEFGPYPYMAYQCYSNKPVADQWEINKYMMDMLKSRYASLQDRAG